MGFGELDLLQLQQYWWIIISLLGGLLVFMMFVQGGQTLMDRLSTNPIEKSLLINSLGRKWELGFTTLVLFGGAMFAAFPLFYATSFGGAYWVWLAILFCFIIQAVSYEYRTKPNNLLGQRAYEFFLKINGSLGVFLLGVALSTLFSGANFSLDANHFVSWANPWRGLEALLNPYNYLLGLALMFLAKVTGALYFINNIDNEAIRTHAFRSLKINFPLFLLFFVSFLVWTMLLPGYTVQANGMVVASPFQYLHNFLAMPVVLALFLIGVLMVIGAVLYAIITHHRGCIKLAGTGVVLSVMSLLMSIGLNQTPFYPSLVDPQSSLSIMNSSSSHYTLTVMSYVSLMVPFVLAYIAYVWYSMDRVKLSTTEIEAPDAHNY
jgi:cytochrome d ubiquinol oxidase subunit II